MKKLFVLLPIAFALFSCAGESDKTVTVDGRYSLTLPSFLSETTALHEEASLQYQNPWREFYVVVTEESKEEIHEAIVDNDLTAEYSTDIDGYAKIMLAGFLQSVSVTKVSDILETEINGMSARLASLSGRIAGVDIYYDIAYVEGRETYYQVLAWTLAGKESEYKEKMDQIIRSLTEL